MSAFFALLFLLLYNWAYARNDQIRTSHITHGFVILSVMGVLQIVCMLY